MARMKTAAALAAIACLPASERFDQIPLADHGGFFPPSPALGLAVPRRTSLRLLRAGGVAPAGTFTTHNFGNFDVNVVRLGLNYKLDWWR
jgi:hypothetical protein